MAALLTSRFDLCHAAIKTVDSLMEFSGHLNDVFADLIELYVELVSEPSDDSYEQPKQSRNKGGGKCEKLGISHYRNSYQDSRDPPFDVAE